MIPNEPDLTSRIANLPDQDAIRILTAVTNAQQRTAGPTPQWSPDLARELCADLQLPPAAKPAPAGDLARQALRLLAEDPASAGPIDALIRNPAPQRFAIGPVSGTILLTCALIALQSHVEFSRDKNGKWQFKYKKAATKDKLLTPLIQRLISLISGGPPTTG